MSELEIVDYQKVASQIRALQPRALTGDQLHDVITLLEWMKTELLARDAELAARQQELDRFSEELEKREKDVVVRLRLFTAMNGFLPKRRLPLFGRHLYR